MTKSIKSIRLGPITVDRRYDQKRQCLVNDIRIGRVTITMSEREAARNELWLACLETPNAAT